MTIACHNPINAIIFMLITFLSNISILFLFSLDLIAFFILIIYVGAILVLFLFILMMINIKYVEYKTTTHYFVGLIILVVFSIQLVYMMEITNSGIQLTNFSWVENNMLFIIPSMLDSYEKHVCFSILGIMLYEQKIVLIIGVLLLLVTLSSICLSNWKRWKIGSHGGTMDVLRLSSTPPRGRLLQSNGDW